VFILQKGIDSLGWGEIYKGAYMPKGIVTAYDRRTAQGTILNESGQYVFVDINAISFIPAYLGRYDLVEFDEIVEPTRLKASNVRKIEVPSFTDPSKNAHAIRSLAFSDGKFYKGTVKWFNNQKGFGYIGFGENDVFVYHTELDNANPNLEDEEVVSFSYEISVKGLKATKVLRDGGAAADAVQP
jgi:CspA family cold shock protein